MNFTALQTNGLKLMLSIAQRSNGTPVQAPVLAEFENLKVGYVGKILFKLRTAGLIQAARGKNGGYSLVRDGEEISVFDVLKALEVKEFDSHVCPNVRKNNPCAHSKDCGLRPVMQSIDNYIETLTSSISLTALVQDEKEMVSRLQHMDL
ncbi:MAG: Rrf2 family transcriptional regulator [Acidobacteria bacterium]|nr:Rrf2 family transcriptional regulator [Acidobacteriota bacterium]